MKKKAKHYSIYILLLIFAGIILYQAVLPVLAVAESKAKYKNWYYIGEKNPMGQCRFFDERPCGVSLYGCSDGRLRYCISNVWVKE